jgi:hypothetical protein
VVFGKSTAFAPTLFLSTLDGSSGFRIDGANKYDFAGISVSGAGDVDGDGFDDVIVGAEGADSNLKLESGSSYIIYGNDFRLEADFFGSATGTVAAEIFVGDALANTINGGGGKDTVNAGAGDDMITVADRTFFRIDGGGGVDTLELNFDGSIVFGNIDANALTSDRGRIAGIEIIDVDNGLNNAMVLAAADLRDIDCLVQDVGGKAELDNVLRVNGNVGDTLDLSLADGWASLGDGVLAGYNLFEAGGLKLAVDTDIQVIMSMDLSLLDGSLGFRVDGVAATDLSATSVSGVGDINGDGFADFIIGAPNADPYSAFPYSNPGAAYVVFGKAGGWTSAFDLSTLDGTNGFRLVGKDGSDFAGGAVALGGDVTATLMISS